MLQLLVTVSKQKLATITTNQTLHKTPTDIVAIGHRTTYLITKSSKIVNFSIKAIVNPPTSFLVFSFDE